jgi:hypothetical protein
MAFSFSNLQIRSDDNIAVKNALTSLEIFPAFVSKPENDWVSVFPFATENQNEADSGEICRKLSADLGTAVFVCKVKDSDVFTYDLAVNGELIDSYNSWPGYPHSEPTMTLGGKAACVLPFCIAGTTCDAIDKVLLSGGKGLDSGLTAGAGLGSIKNQMVNSSPWWAKPFVWSGMTIMALWKRDQADKDAVIWRGIRLATAFATLLDVVPERMNSGYLQIKDGSAAISRRVLTHVMSAADAEYENDINGVDNEGIAAASADLNDSGGRAFDSGGSTAGSADLNKRAAFGQYLIALKCLLAAPLDQEAFKKLCLANGLTFAKQKIDMQGLGPSPLVWSFSLQADSAFQLTTVPKKGKVHWASSELVNLKIGEQKELEEQYACASDQATRAWGAASARGVDEGGNAFAIWQGQAACLIIYLSPKTPGLDRRSLDLWWEPGLQIADTQIQGCIGDWLNQRHPDLF